jgi:hypothetical protein
MNDTCLNRLVKILYRKNQVLADIFWYTRRSSFP